MTETLPTGIVNDLFVGHPRKLWPDRPESAIAKSAIQRPLEAGSEGFFEDAQADRMVHGGPEKAIHHYAGDNLAFWRARFPEVAKKFVPGCFGENISSTGLHERNLHLGDILKAGTVTVQVCQGRQPCWKLGAHIGLEDIVLAFRETGKTGWYYRVLEEGAMAPGDEIRVMRRPHPDWPLSRVIAARFSKSPSKDAVDFLSRCPELSESWRASFIRQAEKT
jgi:MOSC domain-containing protein YiiM